MFDANRLREVVEYNQYTGIFIRIKAWQGTKPVSSIVGSTDEHGYLNMMLDGTTKGLHVLAVLYMTGKMPSGQVDHKDHNPSNNIYSNLRIVSHKDNNKNRSIGPRNNSGFVGVHWSVRDKKWIAQINTGSKIKHLGSFDDKADAIDARKCANIEYGYHENHGKPNQRKG